MLPYLCLMVYLIEEVQCFRFFMCQKTLFLPPLLLKKEMCTLFAMKK